MGNIFAAHLKLVDAVANRDKFVGAPDEAVHLDGLDALLQLVHRRLVVPGLHVEQDGGLGDKSGLLRLLGGISLRRQKTLITLLAVQLNLAIITTSVGYDK